MLGKLMKYEIKSTARWFLPLYAAILIFAVLSRHFRSFSVSVADEDIFSLKQIFLALSSFLYIALFVGIMVVTLVVMIQRFYKNLLGDEGYLMFTLPVSASKHILNKLVIALLWSLLSGMVAFGSILILVPSIDLSEIVPALAQLGELFGKAGSVIFLLLTLLSLVCEIVQIYAAIVLGHLFSKHKLLASFGMYLVLGMVSQFAYLVVMPLFIKTTTITSFELTQMPSPTQLTLIFCVLLLVTAILSAGFFIITNMILKKKLNLE